MENLSLLNLRKAFGDKLQEHVSLAAYTSARIGGEADGLIAVNSADELAETIAEIAGKEIHINHIEGPVGVLSRNFSNERIYAIGWEPKVFLKEGISRTYPWIEKQVKAHKS